MLITLTKEIVKRRPGELPTESGNRTRGYLLDMARAGMDRPTRIDWENHWVESHFTEALRYFTTPSHPCYNPDFVRSLTSIAPEWLDWKTELVRRRKERILGMIMPGVPMYKTLDPGDCVYCGYCLNPNHELYDDVFEAAVGKVNYGWIKNNDRRYKYIIKDLEEFFLTYRKFPSIRAKGRRERYLYYWRRDRFREKTDRVPRGKPQRPIDPAILLYLEQSKLPNNLFDLDLRFFNTFISGFNRLEQFYIENGRLPKRFSRNQREQELSHWLVSRKRVPKAYLWIPIARILLKEFDMPEDTFAPIN